MNGTARFLTLLLAVDAAGFEVNDIQRLDVAGDHTNVAITWDQRRGMTRYIQGFNETEDRMIREIRSDLLKHTGLPQ